MTAVAEATYRRMNPTDDWYAVIYQDRVIGQVYKTKGGYRGFCINAPKMTLGPAKRKEELGQLILSKWEAFPVD